MTPTTISAAAQPASSGPKWIGGNMPVARLGLILNLFVPLIFLIADALHGQLGADPVKEAIHTTGLVAVTFLVASLAITPVKMVTNWGWLIQFRRSVGVFAFYYACAHLAIYFWWDRERSLGSTVYEITHRYYLLIGFLSLVLMLPLWATSFNGAIKALGGKRWKQLHRLALWQPAWPASIFICRPRPTKVDPMFTSRYFSPCFFGESSPTSPNIESLLVRGRSGYGTVKEKQREKILSCADAT